VLREPDMEKRCLRERAILRFDDDAGEPRNQKLSTCGPPRRPGAKGRCVHLESSEVRRSPISVPASVDARGSEKSRLKHVEQSFRGRVESLRASEGSFVT